MASHLSLRILCLWTIEYVTVLGHQESFFAYNESGHICRYALSAIFPPLFSPMVFSDAQNRVGDGYGMGRRGLPLSAVFLRRSFNPIFLSQHAQLQDLPLPYDGTLGTPLTSFLAFLSLSSFFYSSSSSFLMCRTQNQGLNLSRWVGHLASASADGTVIIMLVDPKMMVSRVKVIPIPSPPALSRLSFKD